MSLDEAVLKHINEARAEAGMAPSPDREKADMKAAVCYEFGKPLVIEDLDLRAPRPDEVLVKVAATAICHSDLHDMNGDFGGGLPFVGGHETAGPGGRGGRRASPRSSAGDPVVVSLLEHCGECFYCTTGRPYFCETKVTYDVTGTL